MGGYYYLTTDEIGIHKKDIFLIEGKYSKNALLPSISDIKDGLLKMILYSNLSSLYLNGKVYKNIPVLSLTSIQLKGRILSSDRLKEINHFIKENQFNEKQIALMNTVFKEANYNKFLIEIKRM